MTHNTDEEENELSEQQKQAIFQDLLSGSEYDLLISGFSTD
jgi:hypothetical protein